jgi:hypothetical protein
MTPGVKGVVRPCDPRESLPRLRRERKAGAGKATTIITGPVRRHRSPGANVPGSGVKKAPHRHGGSLCWHWDDSRWMPNPECGQSVTSGYRAEWLLPPSRS